MQFKPSDVVRTGSATAIVIEDRGERLFVVGMVGKFGPFRQHWIKRINGKDVITNDTTRYSKAKRQQRRPAISSGDDSRNA